MIYQVPAADVAAIQVGCPADYPYDFIVHGTQTYTEDIHGWRLARFFDLDAAVAAATIYPTFDAWLAGAGTAIGANVNDQFVWLPAASPPVVTALQGNGLTHSTDANAKRVTVTVVAPVGGNSAGRPTIDGKRISGSAGGGNFVFQAPGVMVIATHAGNNDLVIVEEF